MSEPRPAPTAARVRVEDPVVARVQATIRPDILGMAAYPVAKAAGFIKLDANENPHELPGEARAQMAAAVAKVAVNRYPDGGSDNVKAALRQTLQLDPGTAMVLGTGADELLQLITTVVARPGVTILAPEPTFVMYRLYAQFAHLRYVGVDLRDDFTLDVSAMLAAIAARQPALIWLPSPNNPTGNAFAAADIARIIRAAPGLVVVDEAYQAFADDTILENVLAFPNLILVRTLSKIGMAGVRLGYALGHPAWITEIDKVRSPYNVNALTQAAVPVLLAHKELLDGQVAAILRERQRVTAALAVMRHVQVFSTQANFFVARVPDAVRCFATLREAGILVKNLHGGHPLLAQCLRITVGAPAENDALLQTMARCA